MAIKNFLKRIFEVFPFKKQIFSVLQRTVLLPPKLYQHLYFIGPFKVQVESKKSFVVHHIGAKVENEIFWSGLFGSWEKVSLKVWSVLCRDSNYIFDIGANTGIYALLAKTLNEKANVYAFEPVQRVFERLESNIIINKYDIVPFNIGLSNYDGSAKIFDPGTDHLYSVTLNAKLSPDSLPTQEVTVDVSRFDSWYKTHKISGIDLMKIDVETHEPEVVEGMLGLMKEFKPTVIIEVLNKAVADKLEGLLGELNYIIYGIDENVGLQKLTSITKSPGFNLLLCTENSEHRLIKSGVIVSEE